MLTVKTQRISTIMRSRSLPTVKAVGKNCWWKGRLRSGARRPGSVLQISSSALTDSRVRRAKLEGRRIGHAPLDIDREQIVRDRRSGMSLREVALRHGISRASVCRLVKDQEQQLIS
jgi:hypothetical protein